MYYSVCGMVHTKDPLERLAHEVAADHDVLSVLPSLQNNSQVKRIALCVLNKIHWISYVIKLLIFLYPVVRISLEFIIND